VRSLLTVFSGPEAVGGGMGQSSGWEIYYRVLLAAALSLLLPLGLTLASRLVRRKRPKQVAQAAPLARARPSWTKEHLERGVDQLGRRLNTRFFLAANSALALIALALALVPGVVLLSGARQELIPGEGVRALLLVLSLSVFLLVGLLYSSRKGDLSWVRSFRREDES